MNELLKRMIGVVCILASASLIAPACGGEEDGNNDGNNESNCEEGQTFASVNGGPEECYDKCVDGMCDEGFSCQSGLCIADDDNGSTNGATNGATNGSTNNGTNGATNGGTNGTNGMTNGGTNGMTNGGTNNANTCAYAVDPPLGDCDPLCQTGCIDPEQACVAGASGPNAPLTTQCQPAGPGTQGDACDQQNLCEKGYGCVGATQDDLSCAQYCTLQGDDVPCDDPDATCQPFAADQMQLGICVVPMDACDPLNDMCPDGQACKPTTSGKQCVPTAGKMAGDTCAPGECDKGLLCVSIGGGDATCRIMCDPNDGSNCSQDQNCQALDNAPDTGICI